MMIGPMKRKMITTGVISFILPTIIFAVIFGMYSSKQKEEIARLEKETAVVMRYVFSGDLPVNHVVTMDDIKFVGVKEISAPLDSYPNQVFQNSDINKIFESPIGRKLKVKVSDKTIVTESVFYNETDEVTEDTRIKEFNMITLPSDLKQGDYVDIRILFPTGEDYLVLVGKEIKQLGQNASSNSIFMELTEEEMVKLSGAIIESYIADSVKLYAVKYVNNYQQLVTKESVDYVEKYEVALQTLISGDYLLAVEEAKANLEPLTDESGEIIRDVDGNPKMPEINVEPKAAADYTTDVIANMAGISLEIAQNIKNAFASGDEALLTYYRNQTIEKKNLLTPNYPVREEVYALIQNNPNILDTLKVKYNIDSLEEQRQSLINTSVFEEDTYTGEIKENTSVLSAIAKNLNEEIETQKAERKDFLQNMIRNNVAAGL